MKNLQGEAFLIAISSLSLAFAGFVGLITAVDKNEKNARFGGSVEYLLENLFLAFFFELLPFPLYYGYNCDRLVWSWSSLFFGILIIFALCRHVFLAVNVWQRGKPPRMKWWLVGMFVGTFIVGIMQLYSFKHPSLWRYATGLIWLLLTACGQCVSSFRSLLYPKPLPKQQTSQRFVEGIYDLIFLPGADALPEPFRQKVAVFVMFIVLTIFVVLASR
jgi:hypothetical protein